MKGEDVETTRDEAESRILARLAFQHVKATKEASKPTLRPT